MTEKMKKTLYNDDEYETPYGENPNQPSVPVNPENIKLREAKQNGNRRGWALTPSLGFYQMLGRKGITLTHYAWEVLLFIAGATLSGSKQMTGISSAKIAAHLGIRNPTRVDDAIKKLAEIGAIKVFKAPSGKMKEARVITLETTVVYAVGTGDDGKLMKPKDCYDRINKTYKEKPKPDKTKKPKALKEWEEKVAAEKAVKEQEKEDRKKEGLAEVFRDLKMYQQEPKEQPDDDEDLSSLSPEERAAKLDEEGLEF